MAIRDTASIAKSLYLFAVIILLVGSVIFINWAVRTKPVIAATTHQPERFTELYFTYSNNLPSSVHSGQLLPVSFTVHNAEGHTMTYVYSVKFVDSTSNQTIVFNQHQFSLPNDKVQVITDDIKLPTFNGRAEATVALINQPETIHFWVVNAR
jgi:uncharacterized membrane protein